MNANRQSETESLTKSEPVMLESPTAGRGRGTTGGGGRTIPPETARTLMGSRLGARIHEANKGVMEKPGCGHSDHDVSCLCDVYVKQVTPINVAVPHNMMYASVICEHMQLEAPWDTEKMLLLLGMCSRAHDMLHDEQGESRIWRHNKKVTDEAREYMAEAVEAGTRNIHVMQQVKELFDIEVSQAYISKRRYIYNGTKGAKK